MIKYQRQPQETTEEQGLRTVKMKFVGMTLSLEQEKNQGQKVQVESGTGTGFMGNHRSCTESYNSLGFLRDYG